MFGRVPTAWLASIVIHGLLVALLAWWLWDKLDQVESPPEPTTLNLAMFQAPAPAEPAPQPAPVEPAAEPERMPEPEPAPSPQPDPVPVKPLPQTTPTPKPVPKPKPKPVPPKPTPPKPAKTETRPVEPTPSAPVESLSDPVQVPPLTTQPSAALLTNPTPDPTLEEEYRVRVRRAVDEHKHYPRMAQRLGLDGRVVLAFTVEADGSLVEVRVVESSGSELLDEAALEAVRKAAPFPPFPPGIERLRWDFILPLQFSFQQ